MITAKNADKEKAVKALQAAGFSEAENIGGVVMCAAATPAERRKARQVLRNCGYNASQGFCVLMSRETRSKAFKPVEGADISA